MLQMNPSRQPVALSAYAGFRTRDPWERLPIGNLLLIEDDLLSMTLNDEQTLRAFVDFSGRDGGRIAILAAGIPDPLERARGCARCLREMGAGLVRVIYIDDPKQADDEHVITLLDQATGILIAAPQRFGIRSLLDGTAAMEMIRVRISEGCTVASTKSAARLIRGDTD